MKYVPLTTVGSKLLLQTADDSPFEVDADTPEGLDAIAPYWARATWSNRLFNEVSWLGVRMKQLPEDVLMLQEVFWEVLPDVVIETGVAEGGSAIFWASLLAVTGGREVISIDIAIPEQVRQRVASHPVGNLTRLVEGDAVDADVVGLVSDCVHNGDRVLVALDSSHTKDHVLAELDAYADLVSPGSYIVVTDGVMQVLTEARKGTSSWEHDNPLAAAEEWLPRHPEFVRDLRRERFGASYFPGGWLRRVDHAGDASSRAPGQRDEPVDVDPSVRWRSRVAETESRLRDVEAARDDAERAYRALLGSTTWRVGRALVRPVGRIARRLRGRPPPLDPRDRLGNDR